MSGTAISQRSRVMRLYRHMLKDTLSWVFSRDVWMAEVPTPLLPIPMPHSDHFPNSISRVMCP